MGAVRRDADFFGERELDLVYVAKRLRDALRLEKAFNEAGVDYAIQTETYQGGIIFRTERVGAFFYVGAESLEAARQAVANTGLSPYTGG